MQMMRAKCKACAWTFDVASLPGPATEVCRVIDARCLCPICYADCAALADPRPLTDAEISAKGLGLLGTASTQREVAA